MLKIFIQDNAYYILSILVSIVLIVSSFSYTGYKFYILFILCVANIVLTLKNMYKRGAFRERKYRR